MDSLATPFPSTLAASHDLLQKLLDVSLTGVMLSEPVYGAGGEIVDFQHIQLNQAAQGMLGQPARLAGSFLTEYPHAVETGVFDFYCAAYQSGDARQQRVHYPYDGLNDHYQLSAQRSGDLLLVSFNDTTTQHRLAAEQAQRDTLARQQTEQLNRELEARVQERTQALAVQQQLLNRILGQVPAAVGTLSGPEHRYTFANEHYHTMVGKRDIVGQTVAEALPEVVEQGFIALLDRVRNTGEPFIGREVPIQLYDEATGTMQQQYLNFVYQPLTNAPGYGDDILVFAVDVTPQVQARQEAEATAQRLRLITDSLPVLIGYLDLQERYQFTNEAYRSWFGQDPQALLGRPVRDIVGDEAYAGVKQYIDRALAGEHVNFESRMPYRADLLKYIRTSYVPDVQAGELRGFYTLVTDITEETLARQRVEHANQELEARVQARTEEVRAAQALAERERALLQALLTQAPVAIGLFQGPKIRVTAVNPMMAELWGHPVAEILGRPLLEGVPELQGQGFDDLLRQVLSTHEPITGTETPATMLRAGELKTTYYNYVYTPLYDSEGRVLGIINVATEVTAQVEARRQIEQLNREAQTARAEAERQRGELERVFEQSPIAIAVYRGPNYIIELANPTVARLWGRTREQLIGKGLFEALPEVAGMGYEELLDGVMATGIPHEAHAMEAQHERNGQLETVYWDFIYVPMYEADGSIYGAMVVANEVTQQVLARQEVERLNQQLETRVLERTRQLADALTDAEEQREQLRVQQGLLNGILGQVPAAIATLGGPEHRFTFFNELYQELSANRTVLGQTVAEVFPEVVAQGFISLLDGVYASGEPFIGTDMAAKLFDAKTGQPEQRYVDFIYQPLFDGQRRVTGILAFILDVTDRVLARQQSETLQAAMLAVAQRRAQEREDLYQVFEQAPIGVVLLREPAHRIEYFNPAYAELLGGRALRGQLLAQAQPESVEQGLIALLDDVYATGTTRYGFEQPLGETLDGEIARYINYTYQAYREQDRIVGVAVFIYEVSEQVRARRQVQVLNEELAAINEELQATNEELHGANNRLTHTNADLDTFVYTASHDLKAPISNIEGLLDALREYLPVDSAEPMVPRLLSMMQDSVARFQQTVAHLTDVSRLQHEQEAEAVNLPALVEDVRLDLGPLIATTQARLLLDVETCPTVYFSVKNLRSILYNLLSNALKYRSPDRTPEVQLRATCTETLVQLEVQDNGLGLSEQQQGRLFALFRRLHTHVEGSGVGLYMLKRIVENAGGSIRVQSEPNAGSTFTVTLPRARPAR
ncbi:PAS domain-containing protein [Hymenobacter sp. ASUV-10]|uniref:histidine kinase n=1 Tax=Hymenobacter aranciens TaxID=3063996 RepID=A0ABT9B9I4_9BACT|nr:PAS domain-containing protein [Hymenobacter sp. ASUV-10]MDO7874920.1 PAS domain-containing protein [Hymenobacter sp. ASUV-10]